MLSAYMDGELTQSESQRVRVHLESCDDCRGRYETMRKVQQVASEIEFPAPAEEAMLEIERKVSVRAPRAAGWWLLLSGAVAWIVYATWLFVTDPELASWEKLMTGAVVIGFVLLLVSVLRERLLNLRHDRYRSIRK